MLKQHGFDWCEKYQVNKTGFGTLLFCPRCEVEPKEIISKPDKPAVGQLWYLLREGEIISFVWIERIEQLRKTRLLRGSYCSIGKTKYITKKGDWHEGGLLKFYNPVFTGQKWKARCTKSTYNITTIDGKAKKIQTTLLIPGSRPATTIFLSEGEIVDFFRSYQPIK